eukprot:6879810-Ditylum_brightwellii.AAC.1
MEEMKEKQVDLWEWVETNINWTKNMISKAKYYGRKIFKNLTLFTSKSDDPADYYQQGGTCLGVTDKLTGRNNPGDNTVTAQQQQILWMNREKILKPRTQWNKDITPHIHKWKNEGEVLMIVAANSGLEDADCGLFKAKVGLMQAFVDGIHSDHQGIYCDLNLLQVFRGDIHQLPDEETKQYHSKFKKKGKCYRKYISMEVKYHNLCERAKKLKETTATNFTDVHRTELEEIDSFLASTMLNSKKHLPTFLPPWWSDTLHKAHLT